MIPTNPVILKNCLEILSLLRLFAYEMYLSDLPKLSYHFLLGGSSEKKHVVSSESPFFIYLPTENHTTSFRQRDNTWPSDLREIC